MSKESSLLSIVAIVSLGAITAVAGCTLNNDGLIETPALHKQESEPVPLRLVSLSLSGIQLDNFEGARAEYSATVGEDVETTMVTAEANCDVGVGIEDRKGSTFRDSWSRSETVVRDSGISWRHGDGYYPCKDTRLLSREVKLTPGNNKITVRVAVTFGGTRTEREYATTDQEYTITITRKRPEKADKRD